MPSVRELTMNHPWSPVPIGHGWVHSRVLALIVAPHGRPRAALRLNKSWYGEKASQPAKLYEINPRAWEVVMSRRPNEQRWVRVLAVAGGILSCAEGLRKR